MDELVERWPHIKFKNIPSDWVFAIDEMLSLLRYNKITEVYKENNCLVVLGDGLEEKHYQIVDRARRALEISELKFNDT